MYWAEQKRTDIRAYKLRSLYARIGAPGARSPPSADMAQSSQNRRARLPQSSRARSSDGTNVVAAVGQSRSGAGIGGFECWSRVRRPAADAARTRHSVLHRKDNTSFQAWPDTTTNKVRGPGAHSSYSKALPLIHFAGAGAGGTGIGRMFAIRQPVAVLTSV